VHFPHSARPLRSRRLTLATWLAAACLHGAPAAALPAGVVEEVRRAGCDRGGGAPPLQRSPQLDAVADRLARGASLQDALRAAGYRADEALSIHVSGGTDDRSLRRVLSQRFCRDLANPNVREAGLAYDAHELWLVLAAPFEPPAPREASQVARRVLDRVNAARAAPRSCGRERLPAAPPLTLSSTLGVAALAHSREMAARSRFAHEGADGSTAAERVARTGYDAMRVGENIAAGPTSADQVVQGWLDSPGHCANLMDARFTEMGLAYAVDARSASGIYWTQVFATPR
jgi:uncharacterized protein YkwD